MDRKKLPLTWTGWRRKQSTSEKALRQLNSMNATMLGGFGTLSSMCLNLVHGDLHALSEYQAALVQSEPPQHVISRRPLAPTSAFPLQRVSDVQTKRGVCCHGVLAWCGSAIFQLWPLDNVLSVIPSDTWATSVIPT